MKTVCLAILNYNGKAHLEHLLPTALAAAQAYPGEASVLVLDNRSPGEDLAWVAREHPGVRCVLAPQNDFLFSYNTLLPELTEEVVILLNNDLRVSEGFIQPLINHFQASDVFAVGASSFDWEGHQRTIGPAPLRLANGFYDWMYEFDRQQAAHTLFASGGFMAVDRLKFLELRGFSRLYHPAYCEDLDLGFRAWRRGWRSIYEPASVVWHREHGSWDLRPSFYRLHLRNALLFQWFNLPMHQGRGARAWSMLKMLGGDLLAGRNIWLAAYPAALRRWWSLRDQYEGEKVSQEELAAIVRHIESPVEKPEQLQ